MESNGDGLADRRRLEEINLIATRERVKRYFKVRKRSYREQSGPFTLNAEIINNYVCVGSKAINNGTYCVPLLKVCYLVIKQ